MQALHPAREIGDFDSPDPLSGPRGRKTPDQLGFRRRRLGYSRSFLPEKRSAKLAEAKFVSKFLQTGASVIPATDSLVEKRRPHCLLAPPIRCASRRRSGARAPFAPP